MPGGRPLLRSALAMAIPEPHPATPAAATPPPYAAELGVFRRLRRVALVAPLVFVLVLEGAHLVLDRRVSPWTASLLVAAVAVVLIVVFYVQVFDRLSELQDGLARQNRELLALHQAGLAVVADLSLDSVLQTVVNSARSLVGTRYGAISVIDDEGRIRSFLTSGIPPGVHERIGEPPHGRGLLGVVLQQGQRLRLEDLGSDPRSVGFPAHHPEMRTLLAVPVACEGPYRGNLYLSEKLDETRFEQEDEDTLVRFAAQAAVAIDNAYLHRQVRELGAAEERLRIAHEMHDGLAQVLAYVNTKAQVVREHLRRGRGQAAEEHLGELADAARSCYADVRGQILELRSANALVDGTLAEAITEFVRAWEGQAGVRTELEVSPEVSLRPEAELQALRILQEALTNVRKHADASRVTVRLLKEVDRVRLVILDDGVGLAAARGTETPRPRFGLATMRERAESVGGQLEITSSPGEGTRIEVEIPRRQGDEENRHAPVDR